MPNDIDVYLNPTRWEQMKKLAESLIASKAFPQHVKNAPQALVMMQAGMEMGLKPIEAINGLTIINGAITPWGKTTVKLLKQHGWKIKYKMSAEKGGTCTATITKGKEEYTDSLSYESAEKSGWTHTFKKDKNGFLIKDKDGNYIKVLKPAWKKGINRELKLRYGVLSKIIKTYVPEVLGSAADIAEVAEDYVIEEPVELLDKETAKRTENEEPVKLDEFLKEKEVKKATKKETK